MFAQSVPFVALFAIVTCISYIAFLSYTSFTGSCVIGSASLHCIISAAACGSIPLNVRKYINVVL